MLLAVSAFCEHLSRREVAGAALVIAGGAVLGLKPGALEGELDHDPDRKFAGKWLGKAAADLDVSSQYLLRSTLELATHQQTVRSG